jgi:dihydrofolate reductase
LILSRQEIHIEGATVVSSLEQAFDVAQSEKIFLIGGGEIYRTFLPYLQVVFCANLFLNRSARIRQLKLALRLLR